VKRRNEKTLHRDEDNFAPSPACRRNPSCDVGDGSCHRPCWCLADDWLSHATDRRQDPGGMHQPELRAQLPLGCTCISVPCVNHFQPTHGTCDTPNAISFIPLTEIRSSIVETVGHARSSLAGTKSALRSDDAAHARVELSCSRDRTREDNNWKWVGSGHPFNFGEARFFWTRWTTKTRKKLPEEA